MSADFHFIHTVYVLYLFCCSTSCLKIIHTRCLVSALWLTLKRTFLKYSFECAIEKYFFLSTIASHHLMNDVSQRLSWIKQENCDLLPRYMLSAINWFLIELENNTLRESFLSHFHERWMFRHKSYIVNCLIWIFQSIYLKKIIYFQAILIWKVKGKVHMLSVHDLQFCFHFFLQLRRQQFLTEGHWWFDSCKRIIQSIYINVIYSWPTPDTRRFIDFCDSGNGSVVTKHVFDYDRNPPDEVLARVFSATSRLLILLKQRPIEVLSLQKCFII